MGSNRHYWEQPIRNVTVSSFQLQETPVTNRQRDAYLKAHQDKHYGAFLFGAEGQVQEIVRGASRAETAERVIDRMRPGAKHVYPEVIQLVPTPQQLRDRLFKKDPMGRDFTEVFQYYQDGVDVDDETNYRMTTAAFLGADQPALMFNWFEARGFADWIGGRLPTEAEWEFAARGPAVDLRQLLRDEEGIELDSLNVLEEFVADRFESIVTQLPQPGDSFAPLTQDEINRAINDERPLYGWRIYGTASGYTDENEAYYNEQLPARADWGPSNATGLKGMAGGVSQWVEDRFQWNYNGLVARDPFGPETGIARLLRGGCWYSNWDEIQASARLHHVLPDSTDYHVGFRCVVA